MNNKGHSPMENHQHPTSVNTPQSQQSLMRYNYTPINANISSSYDPSLPSFNNNVYNNSPIVASLHSSTASETCHIPPKTQKIKKPSKTSQQQVLNQSMFNNHHNPINQQQNQITNNNSTTSTSTIRKNKPLLFHNIQYDSTLLKPSMLTQPFNSSQEAACSSSPHRHHHNQLMQITTTDPVPHQKSKHQNAHHSKPINSTPILNHSFIESTYPPKPTTSKRISNTQDSSSQACMFHWKVPSTNYTSSNSGPILTTSSAPSSIYTGKTEATQSCVNPPNNGTQFPISRTNPSFPILSDSQPVVSAAKNESRVQPQIMLESNLNHNMNPCEYLPKSNNHIASVPAEPHLLKDSESSNGFLQVKELDKTLFDQNSTNKEEQREKTRAKPNRTRISLSEIL